MALVGQVRLRLTAEERRHFGRIRDLASLQKLGPVEFERFVGHFFSQQGYDVFTTPNSGDQGIDLFLHKGRQTCVVQCKRYRGTVGQATVRDLYGVMVHSGADSAVLVTSGRISRAARDWAHAKPIELLDGPALLARVGGMFARLWLPESAPVRRGLAITLGICLIVGLLYVGRLDPRRAAGQAALPTPVRLTPTTLGMDSAESPLLITAARRQTPPAIDGDLADWPGAPFYLSDHIVYAAPDWDARLDLTARWQLAWDTANLYLAVSVTDDRHVQMQTGERLYEGDSVEIQLDGDYAARSPRLTSAVWQISLSPGDFSAILPASARFRGNAAGQWIAEPGQSVTVAARAVAEGYTLEAAIPWANLNLTPQPHLRLGAALNAIDNDRAGQAIQEVMVSHIATRQYRNPASWGALDLLP